jgi:hypothetical protein
LSSSREPSIVQAPSFVCSAPEFVSTLFSFSIGSAIGVLMTCRDL